MRILVINPGSTSTKFAVYEGETPLLLRSIRHKPEELAPYKTVLDQFEFRYNLVMNEIKVTNVDFNFKAVIGRGGLGKAVPGGVYEINEKMLEDTRNSAREHACNLGCLIAHKIAQQIPGCRCFIADPVVVDELNDYARICGIPEIKRVSIWHPLNQRAIARRFAREIGKKYEDMNLIICHLGGGISVAAHEKGVAVDAPNALDGEGPFSPERAGTIPAADLVRLCFSGKYTQEQILKMITGKGGLNAHLGTTDLMEIEERINNGDEHAKLILDAMIYHVAKAIAAQSAVLCGKVDAILLTGGMAHSDYLTSELRKRIDFLAPTYCFPGEDEMGALAGNAAAVLKGKREAKEYK
ncbi:MAG: butyrate kinase [Muribaculaceae bacterium]|nr:butyrate kinase [Muribaculaceae bacterium]